MTKDRILVIAIRLLSAKRANLTQVGVRFRLKILGKLKLKKSSVTLVPTMLAEGRKTRVEIAAAVSGGANSSWAKP